MGTFDPYSDDPRLGIQKIALCPLSETLVLAGTAGQVIILQMEREEREQVGCHGSSCKFRISEGDALYHLCHKYFI